MKFKNGILIGTVSLTLALSGCSGMSKKEEAAKQAQQEQIRKEEAQRAEEARKKAETKQKLEAEDALVVTPVQQSSKPVVEKLPEAQIAPQPMEEEVAEAPAAMEAGAHAMSSAEKLEIPTEPNTYLVTVAEKNKTHPLYGVGSSMGFVVNGIQGNYIIAKRGETITFKVRTGVKHDFYLTTSPMGWGAAAYKQGVEGQFTYEGDVTFKPAEGTPSTLYFGCRNHNSMGAKIVVVDANADVEAVKAKLENERNAALAKNKSKTLEAATPEKLKQKIAYVEMMLKFKGGHMDAYHKAQIITMLAMAQNQQSAGELQEAFASAQSAVALLNQKPEETGPTPEEIAEMKAEFDGLLVTLEYFIDAHQASYDQTKKSDPSKAVDFDRDVVGSLIIEAKKLAEEHKFKKAKNRISRAENLVNTALNSMLGSQTLVYELNFETPADEYKYEVDRYKSYLELIPVAIEAKKPSEGAIKLADTYVNKGKFFHEKSKESAAAGRWEEAIVVIKDATLEVRRGLRLLGVSM